MTSIDRGNGWTYGDNVDTDVIIPARYLNTSSESELAEHCMEDIDSDFVKNVKPGDFILAGENFGCGSSREHAPIAIKASGIKAVIAKSFARIFFRNSINIGLPILEHAEAVDDSNENDFFEVDFANGIIKNVTQNKQYSCAKYSSEIQKLIDAGGLINYTKQKLKV